MKESMIQEALALFEQRGEKAIEEINAIVEKWEYTNSVDEYRKVDKLSSMVEKYGVSPEQILIRKEEQMMILRFVCWLHVYLKSIRPVFWYIWRDTVIYGLSTKQCASKYKFRSRTIAKYKRIANQKAQEALPLYYAQFGNLEKYLRD